MTVIIRNSYDFFYDPGIIFIFPLFGLTIVVGNFIFRRLFAKVNIWILPKTIEDQDLVCTKEFLNGKEQNLN